MGTIITIEFPKGKFPDVLLFFSDIKGQDLLSGGNFPLPFPLHSTMQQVEQEAAKLGWVPVKLPADAMQYLTQFGMSNALFYNHPPSE